MGKRILLEKAPPPKVALPPPSKDPRDLEGIWIGDEFMPLRITKDVDGKPVPLTPAGQAILDRRVKATYVDRAPYANAAAYCVPPGGPWQIGMLYPFHIFQTKDAVIFQFSEYHTVWGVRMTGSHTTDARAYMGDAVGHWDGDTLVIDTSNYKQPLWIDADGSPASRDAHITFRIHRLDRDGPKLEIETTIDDPKMYAHPWSFVHIYAWRPDMEVFAEYDCENQIGGPEGVSLYGLRLEPTDK